MRRTSLPAVQSLLAAATAGRFLQRRTAAWTWRRVALLARLAGLGTRTGETPIEFGERVARTFPESVATARGPAVLAGWSSVWPLLLRRAAALLLPARVREAAGGAARPAAP